MKTQKASFRFLSLFLAIVLCSTILPASVLAADEGAVPFSTGYTHHIGTETLYPGETYVYTAGTCAARSSITVSLNLSTPSLYYVSFYRGAYPSSATLVQRSELDSSDSATYSVAVAGNYTVVIEAGTTTKISNGTIYTYKM